MKKNILDKRCAGWLLISLFFLQGCAAVATSLVTQALTSPDMWASLLAPRGQGTPYREAGEFYKKSDWPGLEVHATKKLAAERTSADWMVLKSYALLMQEKYEEPLKLLPRAHEINPEDINALNFWAVALRGQANSGAPGRSANLDRAIQVLEKASSIDTTHAATFFILGEAYGERMEWVKSAQAFENAIRLAPESPLVWFGAGKVYKLSGNLDSLDLALERLRALDPALAERLAR